MLIGQVWDSESTVFIDVIGIGSSVYDLTAGADKNPLVRAVDSSAKAPTRKVRGKDVPVTDKSGKLTFANHRAWMWWKLREALDPQSDCRIALPPDRKMMADLTAPRYSVLGSAIRIEAKDSIIKRTGRSPDRGESVVYGWSGASLVVPISRGYETVERREFGRRKRGWA